MWLIIMLRKISNFSTNLWGRLEFWDWTQKHDKSLLTFPQNDFIFRFPDHMAFESPLGLVFKTHSLNYGAVVPKKRPHSFGLWEINYILSFHQTSAKNQNQSFTALTLPLQWCWITKRIMLNINVQKREPAVVPWFCGKWGQ